MKEPEMSLTSKPPTKEYDAGWDRTFGQKRTDEEAEIARKLNEMLKGNFASEPTPSQMEQAVKNCREMAESYGLIVDEASYSGSEIKMVVTVKVPLKMLNLKLAVSDKDL
jgi:hypothetical protein